MDQAHHHAPCSAPCSTRRPRAEVLAEIMVEMEVTRVEVSAAIDAYVLGVLDTWLMPQIDAALAASSKEIP